MISRQGISFIITIIAAKLLTNKEFGLYSYLVSIVIFFTLLVDFGISRAVSKFTAEFNIHGKKEIDQLFYNSLLILAPIIIVTMLIILLFNSYFDEQNGYFLFYLFPVLIFLPITSLFDGILSGLKQFKQASLATISSAIIAIILVYFLISKLKIIGAFLTLDIFYFSLFIFLSFKFKLYKFKFNKEIFKLVGRYSLIIGVSSIGHFLYSRAVTIILGKYTFLEQAGYYELIDRIFMLLSFGFIIAGQVISPKITEMYTSGNTGEVKKLYKKFTSIIIPVSLIISVAVYFIFPIVIKTFLAKYYNPEFLYFTNILIINLPFLLFTGFFAQPFIVGTGHAKLSLWTIPFGIINVVLGLILINYMGPEGVLFSLIITSICNKVFAYSYLYRIL